MSRFIKVIVIAGILCIIIAVFAIVGYFILKENFRFEYDFWEPNCGVGALHISCALNYSEISNINKTTIID
ncbi:MAG: hypothetical protein ACPL1Y_06330, partial [Thermoplasmata archaeon]